MRRTRLETTILCLILSGGLVSAGCHKATRAAPLAVAAAPTRAPAPPPPPPAAPTITLSVDRAAINAGDAATLTWQSANATSVTLDNAIGNVNPSGSRQVRPLVSTSYIATARGAGGAAVSAPVRIAVNVIPPSTPRPPVQPTTPTRTLTLADQFQAAMHNVLFAYDMSSIRASEMPNLDAGAQWLLSNPSVRVTIEGHADERGSQEYNIALGDERAAAVRKYLSEKGVPAGRLETISYGEERPACRELNEDCWQQNRRAQFVMKP